jgi:hypothetical protein
MPDGNVSRVDAQVLYYVPTTDVWHYFFFAKYLFIYLFIFEN